MYPFSPLAPLPPNVDHEHLELLEMERHFSNSGGPKSTMEDILHRRAVLRIEQSVQIVEEIR